MLNRDRSLHRHNPESGAILVFSALLLLVLIGFAALAVDLGNAWSTNRESQTAADIAATSGLFAIPRTFSDEVGAPAPLVTDAVQAEVDDLMLTNAPGGTALISISADGLDMTVDVTVDSNNSFGRAIGAGDSITIQSTASGHIEIGDFAADNLLRPFGLRNNAGRPYQCFLLSVPVVANRPQVCQAVDGDDVDLLEVYNIAPPNNPTCPTPNSPSNLRDGIDHLVETDAATTQTREARDACLYGHYLTMPNAAPVTTPTTSQLTSGLTQGGGPLQAATPPLWEYLVAGLPGSCDQAAIAALPTLEQQSNTMMGCLQSGAAAFVDGLIDSPRFSWAIRTTPGAGSLKNYESLTLIFLNTIVSDDGSLTPEDAQTLNGPAAGSGRVGAVTMYELQLGDLSSSDQGRLMEPSGTDWLEFSLTN